MMDEDHDLPNSSAHVIKTSCEIRFSLFSLAEVGGVGVWCVIRGDVRRSIVFDVVGYDTAVARGDLLFLLLFFFFSFRFSRDWTIEKRLQQERLCDDGKQARVWWWC